MPQLSDPVRATRGRAAEVVFHFEAVAHVKAKQTDDWLVHRSGDERPLAKFSRRVSLGTPTSGVSQTRSFGDVRCMSAFPSIATEQRTSFEVRVGPAGDERYSSSSARHQAGKH